MLFVQFPNYIIYNMDYESSLQPDVHNLCLLNHITHLFSYSCTTDDVMKSHGVWRERLIAG